MGTVTARRHHWQPDDLLNGRQAVHRCCRRLERHAGRIDRPGVALKPRATSMGKRIRGADQPIALLLAAMPIFVMSSSAVEPVTAYPSGETLTVNVVSR